MNLSLSSGPAFAFPPNSPEAEHGLLSCILTEGADVFTRAVEAGVRALSFYDRKCAAIFESCARIHQKGQPIETHLVGEELEKAGKLGEIGLPFLVDCSKSQPTTIKATHYIDTVLDFSAKRETITAAQLAKEKIERGGDTRETIESLTTQLSAITGSTLTRSKGFTIYSAADFENYSPPEEDALLGEAGGHIYWRDRELALLLGPGGVGKSRLVLHLAISQILSREWVGFEMLGTQRRWLIMGNENSARRYQSELRMMLSDATQAERSQVDDHLFIQFVDDTADSLSLDDPVAVKLWRATAAKVRADVLVVDPWEAVIPGNDCNDAVATREGVRQLRAIFSPHSPRFTPLIVHHAREGAEAARKAEGFDAGAFAKGSKTLRSMARFGINVAPEDPDDGARVVLACGKMNNARKFITRGAVMDASTHLYSCNPSFDVEAWRNDVEGKRGGKSCSVRDVVEAVREGVHKSGQIVKAVMESTGASQRTVKARLGDAVRAKYLASCEPYGSYTLGNKKL
ncbi:MAG: AAA family ATPase [Undibacterium sp.]|nr:AAA family ATPase [Opitutaceae bacterium]